MQQDSTHTDLPVIDLEPLGLKPETEKAINNLLRELGVNVPDSTATVPEPQPEMDWAKIKTYATYGGVALGSLWLISKIVK